MNLEKNYMEFIGPKVLDDFIGVLYVFIFTDLMMGITTYLIID